MPVLFEWNDTKAEVNLRKHRIGFDEAQSVFTDGLSITLHDVEHSQAEERLVIIGKSNKRRLLVVVYTERGRRIRLISARTTTRLERRQYEEETLA
jgi:uncharacterized protein